MNWAPKGIKAVGVDAIGIAVLALLTAVFAFGLVAPLALRGRIAAARAEATVRQKQRLGGLTNQVHAAATSRDAARARLAASPLRLDPVGAMNRRLADVVSLAGACGVTVVDLKPGDPVKGHRCVTVPVRLTGRGNYRDVVAMLRRLQDALSDVHVTAFHLVGSPDDSSGVSSCVLDLRWRASAADGGGASVASVASQ